MVNTIQREKYVEQCLSALGDGRVKVITGLRRSGKSFLLNHLFRDKLQAKGVQERDIISLQLDDDEFALYRNPIELGKFLRTRIQDDSRHYFIFLDEIQNVATIHNPALPKETFGDIGFVDVCLSLIKRSNVDLFVTGSNSMLLSKEIATSFRDRHTDIRVYPLSFSEYKAASLLPEEQAFEEYLYHGGMPFLFQKKTAQEKEEYLKNLLSLTYLKDIVEHHGIRNSKQLDELLSVLAENIGYLTDGNSLARCYRKNESLGISRPTIDDYLSYFEDAFLVEKAKRWDIKGNKEIGAPVKYYFSDLGLRNAKMGFLPSDKGAILENAIYNELLLRGYQVSVGSLETFSRDKAGKVIRKNLEVDFIAVKGTKTIYLQSAYQIDNPMTLERERSVFEKIDDSFRKIIVVNERIGLRPAGKGIELMDVLYLLANPNSLD
jgi:predicted AAA+ superfamily ATPase